MNSVRIDIGAYAAATNHLSLREHGAYQLLLMHYLRTEAPIDDKAANSIAKARSVKDRLAVRQVLSEFFELDGEVWRSALADRTISDHRRRCAALKDLQERDSYRRFRSMVLSRDGERCSYCGAVGVPLQLDHIHPRSKGGSDEPDNLTPACKPCNTSKGAKTLEEWRK